MSRAVRALATAVGARRSHAASLAALDVADLRPRPPAAAPAARPRSTAGASSCGPAASRRTPPPARATPSGPGSATLGWIRDRVDHTFAPRGAAEPGRSAALPRGRGGLGRAGGGRGGGGAPPRDPGRAHDGTARRWHAAAFDRPNALAGGLRRNRRPCAFAIGDGPGPRGRAQVRRRPSGQMSSRGHSGQRGERAVQIVRPWAIRCMWVAKVSSGGIHRLRRSWAWTALALGGTIRVRRAMRWTWVSAGTTGASKQKHIDAARPSSGPPPAAT